MTSDKKAWVRERYAAIVTGSKSSCCCKESADSTSAASISKDIGYNDQDLTAVPDGANLGLGCGNPVAIAGIREGEIVLDLGSGAGLDVFLAAERVGDTGRVIGLDMTQEMIDAARKNAQTGGYANVEFRLGDIENMPVEDNSVDLIISNCVLNLVPDKPKAFAEIFRVLKPGGRIAVADIVLVGDLPGAITDDPAAYCACISGAVPRPEYLQGLIDAGLTGVKVETEVDAADLLAGDCCDTSGAGLKGIVSSIKVTAGKPALACG
jgi:arsenite methyltransferase